MLLLLIADHRAAIRSVASYLDPLPPRLPQDGTINRPRAPLERSQSDLRTYDYESLLARSVSRASTAQSEGEAPLNKVFSFNYVWESEKSNFRGMGRHTISVNATPEDQMNHLHRTMSDLTPGMVQQLGDFRTSGIDPSVWQTYSKSRTESVTSSASSFCSTKTLYHREHPDPNRRVTVTRGFAPTLISSSSSSIGDYGTSHYRKDSTVSMTSMSSDGGEPRRRRRKSRHASMPVSDSSNNSPLTTITENPDVPERLQQKQERACEFDESSNNDSAVASSTSSDERAWMPVGKATEQRSHLTKQIERNIKENHNKRQLTRPRIRSGDPTKPRQAGKPIVERSRTVKHVERPVGRRAQSPKRTKRRPQAVKALKPPTQPEQHIENVVPDAKALTAPAPGKAPDIPALSTGSEEACEDPTDLSLYLEKVRSKQSSKGAKAKGRPKEDDNESIDSSSTAKTLVPLVKKMVEALPIHRRQRSATAFRVPLPTCQPPNKGESAQPEHSHATAH